LTTVDRRKRAGLTVTVLGATAPYPGPGRAGPGYLVEGFGSRVLLDCGSGVLSRLLTHCGYTDLDAVILSHLHFDHCSDIFVLRYALDAASREGRLDRPLPVWCPSEPADVAALIPYKRATEARRMVPDEPVEVAGLVATFVPVRHPVEAYGVILRPAKAPAVGSLFFYTGDTEWMDELPGKVGRCEVLLVEASLSGMSPEQAAGSGHLTVSQAVRLGDILDARQVVLTHHPPGREEADIAAESRRLLDRPVVYATEGLRIVWP